MSDIPQDLKYTHTHEWVRDNGDGTVTVGITDHAQDALGDIVFLELPEVGNRYPAKQACAVVESVNAASDIYAPVAGEVTSANEALADAPETISSDPYGEGWIFQLKVEGEVPAELANLLDPGEYEQFLAHDDE